MAEARLETHIQQVQVQLATGDILDGEVFLQLADIYHAGPQRVGALLNGDDCFLPVRCDGHVTLINLRQVVSLSVSADYEADELMTLGKEHEVAVRTAVSDPFSARIYVNLPDGRTRVKDYLNQRLRFLPFFAGSRIIYCNFRYILQVED
jgi:hypothetical protein